MASHLAKHTYYSQIRRGAKLEIVDSDRMRRQVKYVYEQAATPNTKLKPANHDVVDRLFYTGTDGLQAEFLTKYNYNKSTFTEADLPAHWENEEEDVVNDGLKQSADDAEASGDADEDSNKNNAVEGGMVSEQANKDRAGRLPEPGRSKGLLSEPNTNAQVQGAGAGSSSLGNDDASAEPKGKGKASGSSVELKKRPRDNDEDGAPAERSPKASRLLDVVTTTTQAEHQLPTTETQNDASKAPMVTTPREDTAAASDPRVQPPIWLDTDVLTKELGKMNKDTLKTVEAVLECIDQNPYHYSTALDPDPPQLLRNLYVRCWGKDWKAVHLKLTRGRLFMAPQVAKALVSAFLYNNILDQETILLDDLARLRSIASLEGSGEAVRGLLEPKRCWLDLKALADAIDTTQAYALLSQDEAVIQAQFKEEAGKLATSLWSIIVPHFRAVSDLARVYGESKGNPEEAWMKLFIPGMTNVIQQTLRHRLRLRGTGCEHAYTWPNPGEDYHSGPMVIDNNLPDQPWMRQEVLFTVFPGVEVIAPDFTREKLYIRSTVKVRATPR